MENKSKNQIDSSLESNDVVKTEGKDGSVKIELSKSFKVKKSEENAKVAKKVDHKAEKHEGEHEGGHSPLAQFEIKKYHEIKVGNVDLSFTNSSAMLAIVVFAILLLFIKGTKKSALIPGRFQAFIEMIYEFVANMVSDNVGTEGKKYFPFVFSIFLLVLGCNLVGMMPYSFTVTSHIVVTFALALFCFIIINIIGFARHGLHYLHLFVPEGVPKLSLILITPIEVISYLIRPFSLAIRLAAAMTAGHVVMKIFAGFVVMLGFVGILPLAFATGLVGLELLVSFIQAFIFSILICIYLNDAVNMH